MKTNKCWHQQLKAHCTCDDDSRLTTATFKLLGCKRKKLALFPKFQGPHNFARAKCVGNLRAKVARASHHACLHVNSTTVSRESVPGKKHHASAAPTRHPAAARAAASRASALKPHDTYISVHASATAAA